jgi:hypothetical protein
LIADALLVLHFLIVAFIVGGLPTIWIGKWLGWSWVLDPWLRYAHLAAIVFVAAEALIGIACPLTVWEDALRGSVQAESFVGRWVRRLLYYEAPPWAFTAAYVTWAVATLVTLKLVPPRRRAA